MLKGFAKAHSGLVSATDDPRVLNYAPAPIAGKVGVVTGGGSGHKPAFVGYLGRNMVDAVAVGEIFTSPGVRAFVNAFKAADGGKGVACLYGNYAGDNLNVKMAIKMVAGKASRSRPWWPTMTWPPAPKRSAKSAAAWPARCSCGGGRCQGGLGRQLRRGHRGGPEGHRQLPQPRCGPDALHIPAVGKPNFSIPDGQMEVGIGHHGEPGVSVQPLATADEIAAIMLEPILADLPFQSGDEVVVLLSGLGATPVMELYILYNRVEEILRDHGIGIHRSYVGNYFTSLEMMGATVTLMKLDDELKTLIDLDAESMGLTQTKG
jgi:dihydroxyacetone kinase-like protein